MDTVNSQIESVNSQIESVNPQIENVNFQNVIVQTDVKCDSCDYVGRPDNVKAHIKSIHDRIRPICEGCGNNFATKSSLIRHLPKCKVTKSDDIVPEGEILASNSEMPGSPITFTVDDIVSVQHIITLANGTTISIPGEIQSIGFIINQNPSILTPPPEKSETFEYDDLLNKND